MNKRYWIVWAFSTWTTTVFNELQEVLSNYVFISEVAREILIETHQDINNMTITEKTFFQKAVLSKQIKEETNATIRDMSLNILKYRDFISDTSLIDILAYSQDLDESTYKIMYLRVVEYLQHYPYTRLFYIPNEINIEKDWVRHIDKEFQNIINSRIKILLEDFKDNLWIDFILVKWTVAERTNTILQSMSKD